MNVTRWVLAALVLLLLSTIVFLIAFLTNGWGKLTVRDGQDYWDFGLWQCCRESDGKCIGPRWPTFYSAARMCGVFCILGHLLTFGWLLGYALEKILDYDVSTLGFLISLNFITVLLNVATVICFGTRWPTEFEHDYFGTTTELWYGFYLACVSIFLVTAAGVMIAMEMRTSYLRWLKGPPPSEEVSFIRGVGYLYE